MKLKYIFSAMVFESVEKKVGGKNHATQNLALKILKNF